MLLVDLVSLVAPHLELAQQQGQFSHCRRKGPEKGGSNENTLGCPSFPVTPLGSVGFSVSYSAVSKYGCDRSLLSPSSQLGT